MNAGNNNSFRLLSGNKAGLRQAGVRRNFIQRVKLQATQKRLTAEMISFTRNTYVTLLCALMLATGCASRPPSAEVMNSLKKGLGGGNVVADTTCIFSAPVVNAFTAYRQFGVCLFNDSKLHLYYGNEAPKLAFEWPISAIKAYAFHTDTFTLITSQGNVGLVVNNPTKLMEVLHAHGVPEDSKLPIFGAKDPAPWSWM